MATVTALQSFRGVLEKDVLNPPRVEESSLGRSVFPGTVKTPGRTIDVIKGQNYEDNHPAVKKWPEMFGLVDTIATPATKPLPKS